MAKAKQATSGHDPKSMTPEQLQDTCYKMLVGLKEGGDEAKKLNKERRAEREELALYLKALRTALRRQGKKDGLDRWQTWFESNKSKFGISLRTANRWCGDKEEKLKFANLDGADGVILAGKKYSIKLILGKDQIDHIKVAPVTDDQPQATKPVALKKLTAADTRYAIDRFHSTYEKEQKDDFPSTWVGEFFKALEAEAAKHPEWRLQTVKGYLTRLADCEHARKATEEAEAGWTKTDRKHWTHEDGRSITICGRQYMTFDKDGVTIRPTYNLLDAMQEKRDLVLAVTEEAPANKTMNVTVINETREIQLPNLEVV